MLTDRSSSRCHYQMLLARLSWFPFSSGECQPQEATDLQHKEAERMQTHHVVNHPAGFFFSSSFTCIFVSVDASHRLTLAGFSPPYCSTYCQPSFPGSHWMRLRGHSGRWSAGGGGGATLELPSHSGQIVVLQQWSSFPAQDVTWKRILVIFCQQFHITIPGSRCFSRRNNHSNLVCSCLFVVPWRRSFPSPWALKMST